ncbi:MAG: LysM domain-containing protein, partial [Vampirovibrionia bacterium]
MVSNLDTDTINSTIQTVQGNVENQSEDEILDYLMGSKTASMPKELKAVKENVRLNNTKFNIKPKSNEQLEETANAIFNKVAGSLISLFDRLSSSVNKGRNVVSSVDLKPVVSSVKKMHSVELVNIDLTEEQIEFIKAKTQPVRTRLQPVTSKMIKAFDLTFDFIAPKFAPLTEKINLKLPVLKHSFAGVILLIGCAIMAVVSHIAMNVGSQPNEDLLTSRKLAPVNWNVNGQVTEADKVNIKSLLATGQIKVLPKGKKVKANIQLITDTTSIQNKSVSPDTSFMMISSNTVGHTVNYGESVLSISQKYKVSISDLISSNPDADLVNLKPGDSIEIPNVLETSSESQRPSRIYSKMPRNLLASRSMSGLSRANSFNT